MAARCFDLTARWSFNNTFKAVMWIAVSVTKARAARPYVESMTKKVSAAMVALALGAATAYGADVGHKQKGASTGTFSAREWFVARSHEVSRETRIHSLQERP